MNSDTSSDGVKVKSTPAFKLKDKVNRQYQAINLQKQFGFLPEVIIIEKVPGSNNAMVVRAVLTSEELEKEQKMLEAAFNQVKK